MRVAPTTCQIGKPTITINSCFDIVNKDVINKLFFEMTKETFIFQRTPSFVINPKLIPFPTLPPKQKNSPLVAPKNSK